MTPIVPSFFPPYKTESAAPVAACVVGCSDGNETGRSAGGSRLGEEPLRAQLVPQARRDLVPAAQIDVLLHLPDGATPDEHGDDRGMTERERDGDRLERYLPLPTDGRQPAHSLPQLRSGRCVVVGAEAVGARQDAAVEDAAGDHVDPSLETERQQLDRRALVEECVAAGEQEAVDVGVAG